MSGERAEGFAGASLYFTRRTAAAPLETLTA
ncbi:MAG: hypothetical protein JWL71_2261 [Acidobacteria bacterium]|jgi:hypothetical protein|nr:hypothetical protein [Acidobacteriota bacterium]